jgi:hypothetical protein
MEHTVSGSGYSRARIKEVGTGYYVLFIHKNYYFIKILIYFNL